MNQAGNWQCIRNSMRVKDLVNVTTNPTVQGYLIWQMQCHRTSRVTCYTPRHFQFSASPSLDGSQASQIALQSCSANWWINAAYHQVDEWARLVITREQLFNFLSGWSPGMEGCVLLPLGIMLYDKYTIAKTTNFVTETTMPGQEG